MADRSVTVRLQANVGQYTAGLQQATRSTEQLANAGGDAERNTSRIGDTARAVGRTALTGLGMATTAVVGLGTAAFKTGLDYNALEQSSRAALTTLLGSAEAAAAQMDKLREFVRTSPFPREVWIQAQQQLISFGMAAGDVIPTLQSINDAVAATGGSANDIQEVVRVLAQVQSTGRVTAETLNQLGIRGIDAATLIGDAMGKTAGQIREDIRSGALDAQTFLSVLVEQMDARFGSAAANLQRTWQGATDSLRGSFRDLGSALAAPFVDPMGGGAGIDWARSLTASIRGIEPIVADLAQQAGPALGRVTSVLESISDAIQSADVDQVTSQLSDLSPALAGLGAAGATAATGLLPFVRTIGPQGALIAGISAFVLSVPEGRDAMAGLLEAVAPLGPALAELAQQIVPMLAEAIGVLAEALGPAIDLLGATIEGTIMWIEWGREAGLVAKEAGEGVGWWERSLADLLGWTGASADETKRATEVTRENAEANEEAAGGADELAGGFSRVEESASEAADALNDYVNELKAATDPVFAVFNALEAVDTAQRDYNEAVEEYGEESDEAAAAAITLAEKIAGVEQAVLNGDLSWDDFNATLARWVEQGVLTEEAADAIRTSVDEARGAAEDYEGDYGAELKLERDKAAEAEAQRELDEIAAERRADILARMQGGQHTQQELDRIADAREAEYRPGVNRGDQGRTLGVLDRIAEQRRADYSPFVNAGARSSAASRLNALAGTRRPPYNPRVTNTAAANRALNHIARSRTATITVRTVGGYNPGAVSFGRAEGAYVKYMQQGGFMSARHAEVVPANTWRVIGDRPVGDEAFIPIDRSERSRAILAQAADRMGFALMQQGGMLGRPVPAASSVPAAAQLVLSIRGEGALAEQFHAGVRKGDITLSVDGRPVRVGT